MSGAVRRAVTLYTRPGCSLCDEAEEMLRAIARELGLVVEVVNIETSDDLLRRFMFEVPVVAAGGEVLARAPIRRRALEDALGALPA